MAENYLTDKVIVITGAAGGFGRLLCRDALAGGAKVAALDIDADAIASLTADLNAADLDAADLDAADLDAADLDAGERFLGLPTDVTSLAAMSDSVAHAVAKFGSVDVIINNAGTMPLAFLADHAEAADAWSQCIDINIKGVLNGMIAVHDHMMTQGRGHIVNLSSIYGNAPVVGAAVYGATKAAVNMMSEAVRVETQGTIKVTIVKPTGVPGTGLGAGIVNRKASIGIIGQNAAEHAKVSAALREGRTDEVDLDPESIGYQALDPQHIADQILHAINQPWGVSVGDITIRATGDRYIL